MTNSPDLLTVPEAAALMNVGERFVRRLVHEHRIRFYKLGGHVRLASADIEAYLAASIVEPGAAP